MLKYLNIFASFFFVCFPKIIDWKKFSIQIIKENQVYAFGYLIYEDNIAEFRYLHHTELKDEAINEFCRILNFDNFKSFSMKSERNQNENAYQISLNENNLK